jgi:hypothetical protein
MKISLLCNLRTDTGSRGSNYTHCRGDPGRRREYCRRFVRGGLSMDNFHHQRWRFCSWGSFITNGGRFRKMPPTGHDEIENERDRINTREDIASTSLDRQLRGSQTRNQNPLPDSKIYRDQTMHFHCATFWGSSAHRSTSTTDAPASEDPVQTISSHQ